MWFNYILRLSNFSYRLKEQVISSSFLKTIGLAFLIIFFEIFILIISLPLYLFLAPEKISADKEEVEKFKLKRKYSLYSVLGFVFIILLVNAVFFSGVFFEGSKTRIRAVSSGWHFENPVDYIYDTSKIQIVDGMVVLRDYVVEEKPQEVFDVESIEVEEIEEVDEVEVLEDEDLSFVRKAFAQNETCVATLQPVESLFVENLVDWTGFVEVAQKNGGEIYYQFSFDDGMSWYFWNNGWVVASEGDYNVATVVDQNIRSFPTEEGKIMFRAFLENDCQTQMQLLSVVVSYNDEVDVTIEPEVFSGGDGSSVSPFEISNCFQLQEMRADLSAHYVLVNNVDCAQTSSWNAGAGFEPIGSSSSPFLGSFDGRGFVISDLYINRGSMSHVGLFGALYSGGVVSNFGLENVNIVGSGYTGGVAGHIGGIWNEETLVSQVFVTGQVTGGGSTGCLVGYVAYQSRVQDSFSVCTVSGGWGTGGIAGSYWGGEIVNTYSVVDILGSRNGKGGIVGQGNQPVINSFWNVDLFSPRSGAGEPRNTSEMMQMENYVTWNIVEVESFANEIWSIDNGNAYPRLGWQTAVLEPEPEPEPEVRVFNETKQEWYVTIQEAVSDASSSDVIIVNEGVFVENVVVNKAVSIKGSSREGTIVDGNEQANPITVESSNVSIADLTVRNSHDHSDGAGIRVLSDATNVSLVNINAVGNTASGIHTSSDGVRIEGCIVTDNIWGIRVDFSDDIVVENCHVYDNNRLKDVYGQGIRIVSATNVRIKNSLIQGNAREGILATKSGDLELSDITISDSEIFLNGEQGIYFVSAKDVVVESCNIYDNGSVGLRNGSEGSVVRFNSFYGNSNGNYFSFLGSDGEIYENIFGDSVGDNVKFERSQSNKFFNNEITGTSSGFAIALGADANEITENILTENANGIKIERDAKENIIFKNIISENTDYGIRVFSGTGNSIKSNTVMGNKHGIRIAASGNIIYNNYFENTGNVYVSSGLNIWNVEKEEEVNILGGSHIGGNYWSNYSGSNRGDGFGDIDYDTGAGKDALPLVEAFVEEPITQGSIEVLSPAGGEVLEVGASFEIMWSSENVQGDVLIEYSKDGFNDDIYTIASVSNSGSYSWLVPNDVGSNLKIRISEVDDLEVFDVSSGLFSIVEQANISVVRPTGGENLTADSFVNIEWESTRTSGEVRIEYSKDNFVSDVRSVVDSTNDNGVYTWIVPNEPSDSVKVRVVDVENSSLLGVSSAVFRILEKSVFPVSFWPFDENSGCIANDGFGINNGVLSPACPENSPSRLFGKVGRALSFNGVDDFVQVENARSLNPNSSISLSAWVKWEIDPETGESWASIVNKGVDNQYRLHHNRTNTAFEFALRTSRGNRWIASNTKPEKDAWYFVVGTYDGKEMRLYVNGALESTQSWSGMILGSATPLHIGSRTVNDRYFNGVLDEVGLWNRALSASEINAIYLESNNNKPKVEINEAFQRESDGYVEIEYLLTDHDSDYIQLSNYEFSLTGDFTGEQQQMTPVFNDEQHSGTNTLQSSPIGVTHRFVWNPRADMFGQNSDTVYVRIRAADGIAYGEYSQSLSFVVDAKPPVVSGIVVNQLLQSNDVEIYYDLFDKNENIFVEVSISRDGGNSWNVPANTLSGDFGENVSLGSSKKILWKAGDDFFENDEQNMVVKIEARDFYQNLTDDAFSDIFALDTKAPLGLNDFLGVSSDVESIVWSWTPVSIESNFDRYEIWYGQDLDDVANRAGTAKLWSVDEDEALSVLGTSFTTITGLSENLTYYSKIWAVDIFGNEATVSYSEFVTQEVVVETFTPLLNQPLTPTQNPEVIISGMILPGNDIELYINGLLIQNVLVVNPDGTFEGTVTLEEGQSEIYVISNGIQSESRFVLVDFSLEELKAEELLDTGTDEDQVQIQEPTLEEEQIFVLGDILTGVSDFRQVLEEAFESPLLQIPQVTEVLGTDIANNIIVKGRGIPNSNIVVFIHSEQAVIYSARVDSEGNWEVKHSQNDVELAEGGHTVYALTLDAGSKTKSQPGDVFAFSVERNNIAAFLLYFDFTTTVITIALLLTAIAVVVFTRRFNPSTNLKL